MKKLAFTIAAAAILVAAATAQVPARDRGLLVVRVLPDTPAERAGVLRGDILLSLDGVDVDDLKALRGLLAERKAGQGVRLGLLRGEARIEKKATLEERLYRPPLGLVVLPGGDALPRGLPSADGAPGAPEEGLPELRNLLPEDLPRVLREAFRAEAVVSAVVPGSPAEKAGLVPGDRVLSVDGSELTLARDLAAAVGERKPGDKIRLDVESASGARRTVDVVLDEAPGEKGRARLGVSYASGVRERLRFPRRDGGGIRVPEQSAL